MIWQELKEAFQKAVRSLENALYGWVCQQL